MKRLRSSLLVIAAIMVVVVVAWALMPAKQEAKIDGSTIKEWFLAISTTSSVPGQLSISYDDPAILRILDFGTNAVPFLMHEYRRRNRHVESMAELANHWFRMNLLQEDDRRLRAATCLELLGTKAESAVPELIEICKGGNSLDECDAIQLLGSIHSRAQVTIPFLRQYLKTGGDYGRYCTIDALGSFRPQAKPAVPALISLLQVSGESSLITEIKDALQKIDPEAAAKAGIE